MHTNPHLPFSPLLKIHQVGFREQELSNSLRKIQLDRPSMGFPLGFGLLLIMLFYMIAFYAACIQYWNKLRSFLLSSQDVTSDIETDILEYSHRNPVPPFKMPEQSENRSVSVLMPGDQVPKFIAMVSPCMSASTICKRSKLKCIRITNFP